MWSCLACERAHTGAKATYLVCEVCGKDHATAPPLAKHLAAHAKKLDAAAVAGRPSQRRPPLISSKAPL